MQTVQYTEEIYLEERGTGKLAFLLRKVSYTINEREEPPTLEHRCYIWDEGNFSCDCNRHQFWQEAAGIPEEDWVDMPCGDGAYRVVKIIDEETRQIYYAEEPR